MKHTQRAFSLIELMIVVAVIGILAAIAYPNYQEYLIKSRRAVATGCLLELAQFMERHYTTHMSYAGAVLPDTACRTELAGFYNFGYAEDGLTASTYQLEAIPQGRQTADATCGTLRIDHTGARSATGSGGASVCW